MKKFFYQKRVSRGSKFVALAALLALSAIGLTQCRLVDHSVTGVDFQSQNFNAREACMKKCDDIFKAAREAEDKRHKAADKKCDLLRDKKQREACKKAEHDLTEANKKRIENDKKNCKNHCYNEGGGKGGR